MNKSFDILIPFHLHCRSGHSDVLS